MEGSVGEIFGLTCSWQISRTDMLYVQRRIVDLVVKRDDEATEVGNSDIYECLLARVAQPE
jgi:hypothetical protein